jgi:predicted nucleic acid-binding Zn ribbon protein
MQKQIGKGGGVIFRGKGFYAVDYSNDPRIRKGQK